MEQNNLQTASVYINNQLLSRGLLRNGQEIDFARPDGGLGGNGGEGKVDRKELERTMGRIMGVVNDLILRRDRDATQRESLTTTLRTLRADSLLHSTELERLQTKLSDSIRKSSLLESSERALKLQLKSAENREKTLKEDMAKMKVAVGQSRKECAVEVRKRERVIEGLKRHVGEGGRARGKGKEVGTREITVTAGVGGVEGAGASLGVREEGYDLRSETNEFLTELARGLSEENEALAGLVRSTVENLRALSGCEPTVSVQGLGGEEGMVTATENGVENLAGELESVVEHVRHILTNPSFVPLEEVEVRDEEIQRLRVGWERMEERWKEAVEMMEGWRLRMKRSGQTVNLEELKMGLLLSPLKPKDEDRDVGQGFQLSTLMEEGEEGDTQADIDAMNDSEMGEEEEIVEPDFDELEDVDSESSLFEDEPADEGEEEQQVEEEEEEEGFTLNTASSMSPGPAPQLSPLREVSGNRDTSSEYRYQEEEKSREGFTTIVEENTYELLQLDEKSSPRKSQPALPKSAKSTPRHESRREQNSTPNNFGSSTTPVEEDSIDLLKLPSSSSIPPQVPPHREFSPPRKAPLPAASSSSSSLTKPTPTSPPRKPTSFSSPRKSARERQRERDNLRSTPKPQPTPRLQMGSSSRLPRPREERAMQSPLTMASIAAKLAASEREADAARVRAKIKAARAKKAGSATTTAPTNLGTNSNSNSGSSGSASGKEEKERDKRAMPPPPTLSSRTETANEPRGNVEISRGDENRKKRKAAAVTGAGMEKGRSKASRRRSTLSPWELESLILGGVGVGVGVGSPSKE